MINFEKLNEQIKSMSIINPLEIFTALPSRSKKFSYLRNVQAEVLEEWFYNRDQKDSIIKMNTGSGKTTVALLILKSCLSEHKGTALYVVPDSYLIEQVSREAEALGISVTKSEKDIDFLTGESILVINIQKLFNGKSVFGMRNSGNIDIDYLVVDDVHACIEDVKEQFSIKLKLTDTIAEEIFGLYYNDLKNQNEKKFMDIQLGDPNSSILSIPFWRVYETKSALLDILYRHSKDKSIMFNFPLIAEILDHCDCSFSYNYVEIQPYSIPIHKITGFVKASRRIFMSATLSDDSVLVSTFGLDENLPIITPKRSADIGDRMILFPQAYSPQIEDEQLRDKLFEYSQKYNVVIIVPSNYRSIFWSSVTPNIYTAINLSDGIRIINSSKNGLYVFVNKYDGIDLPDDTCRIIVIDGVPDESRLIDKLNTNYLLGSSDMIRNKIQKIEQGIGRGIRSNNDFCGVIIMGKALTNILYNKNAVIYFSEATKKQYEISSMLAKQLKNAAVDEIFKTLDFCINQDPQWLSLSRGILRDVHYNKTLDIDKVAVIQRYAFDQSVLMNNNDSACKSLSNLENETEDETVKGFLMLIRAKYMQFINPAEAQQILMAAQKFNVRLQKPISGIKKYRDIKRIKAQTQQIIDSFNNFDVNEYVMELNAIIDSLSFAPNSYKKFEENFKRLGEMIGFSASRPDNEYNIGPDVIWYIGNNRYLVIECKNEAENATICKSYCSQLLASTSWFDTEYAKDATRVPIIIYPTNVFDKQSSPAEDFRVIDKEKLQLLKFRLKDYCIAISSGNTFKDVIKLSEVLKTFHLVSETIVEEYTKEYQKT